MILKFSRTIDRDEMGLPYSYSYSLAVFFFRSFSQLPLPHSGEWTLVNGLGWLEMKKAQKEIATYGKMKSAKEDRKFAKKKEFESESKVEKKVKDKKVKPDNAVSLLEEIKQQKYEDGIKIEILRLEKLLQEKYKEEPVKRQKLTPISQMEPAKIDIALANSREE
ncbi:hypothetical protein QAD02_003548 [Eretmocerus hayati]|uniref:Uncharacterized protein n=1 Tax=Eretmocerus hayati TaxID=131215 RepID=A0ACC2NPQ0_9HYME|nr:hypothetical protein QAD02_003548 [Eretmocerus hayati]